MDNKYFFIINASAGFGGGEEESAGSGRWWEGNQNIGFWTFNSSMVHSFSAFPLMPSLCFVPKVFHRKMQQILYGIREN